MSTLSMSIPEFFGIDQSGDGNTRNQGTSPDAVNFDTTDGNITVAAGYTKFISTIIPCDSVKRMFIFKGLSLNTFVVAAEVLGVIKLIACDPDTFSWRVIYTYPNTVVGLKWSSIQCNIGDYDYIIFACGEHQLVKWDGVIENDAVLFGSGTYVLETTVSAYSSTTKTITLTDAISEEVKTRMLRIGIVVNSITLTVSSVDTATKKVTLKSTPSFTPTSGQTAKVKGEISNASVNFIAMHYSRLFAAGDPENPTRLYYSQIPGDGRSIEDWSVDEASANTSGGFVEVGDSYGDPILGIVPLSNQLIIRKRYSIYRLIGTQPSTFTIQKIDAEVERSSHSAVVMHGDVPYYMTPAGMYYFNGQTVMRTTDALKIKTFMQSAYIETCKACENKDKLYFSCYVGNDPTEREYDNRLIVYDVYRRSYMIREGFEIADILSHDGTLYMVNGSKYIYKMDDGTDYDGVLINAYWKTPLTDMNKKRQKKKPKEIYFRAIGDSRILFTTYSGKISGTEYNVPGDVEDVVEIIPKTDFARTMQFMVANEAGGWFSIKGGIDIYVETEER